MTRRRIVNLATRAAEKAMRDMEPNRPFPHELLRDAPAAAYDAAERAYYSRMAALRPRMWEMQAERCAETAGS